MNGRASLALAKKKPRKGYVGATILALMVMVGMSVPASAQTHHNRDHNQERYRSWEGA